MKLTFTKHLLICFPLILNITHTIAQVADSSWDDIIADSDSLFRDGNDTVYLLGDT